MPTPPSLPHLHTLSPRERAVVDLAVEGLTDEQIAQRLDLSVSTVNSYWVRIRGKLGPLSRTEIVGTVLRCELGAQSEDLRADKAALEAELARTRDRLRTREAALATCGGDAWPLLAFENQPVAALVVRDPGLIAYANRAACHLLGWTSDALIDRPVWELTVGEDQPIWERSVRAFFEEARVGHAHAGIERAHFAKRGDGTLLRITARAESFDAPQGAMAVVTIREYLDELEALVQALRQTAHLA